MESKYGIISPPLTYATSETDSVPSLSVIQSALSKIDPDDFSGVDAWEEKALEDGTDTMLN